MQNRKYSASALSIIILLVVISVGGIFATLTLPSSYFQSETELLISYTFIIIFLFLYFLALIGVFRKTRWGLVLTIILSVIDITGIVISRGLDTTIYQDLIDLFFDLALMFLSINILNRIN